MLGPVDEVVIDCANPPGLARFWAAILGGEVVDRDPNWSYVLPPNWTQLSFQRVPESKTTKNRLHIDVSVPDLDAAADEAERLGAVRVGTIQHSGPGSFQVLQDPEGNEWCLVRPATA